jgi:hypothetical protein
MNCFGKLGLVAVFVFAIAGITIPAFAANGGPSVIGGPAISGGVYSFYGTYTPAKFAKVEAIVNGRVVATTSTDVRGWYQFTTVPVAGYYTIRVTWVNPQDRKRVVQTGILKNCAYFELRKTNYPARGVNLGVNNPPWVY